MIDPQTRIRPSADIFEQGQAPFVPAFLLYAGGSGEKNTIDDIED
jgi:hypothetical protein